MNCPRIVFVDRATIPPHIRIPELSFDHEWSSYDNTHPHERLERVSNADIIVTNKVIFDADTLSQLPQLKMIAVSATGVNHVDLMYCREHHIAVTNIQGYATRSVPEHVIGMIYALRRNLMGYHMDIARGEWQRQQQFCFFTHPIGDVSDSTLGVIGSGALGKATATLAQAIGMRVIFAERKGEMNCRAGYLPFDDVLMQSDVLTLHCPLTPETSNLIDEQALSMMKPSALLINTGRGGLVDEQALVNGLQQGQIAGAGVDVFTQEPADISNPLLAHQHLPNLLLTPHVAWGSDSAISQLCQILICNIEAFVKGHMQNRVV